MLSKLMVLAFGTAISLSQQSTGIQIQLNGKSIGYASTLNIQSGNGIMWACIPPTANGAVTCTPGYNTALIPTHDPIHGNENFCNSTHGTSAFTCTMPSKA